MSEVPNPASEARPPSARPGGTKTPSSAPAPATSTPTAEASDTGAPVIAELERLLHGGLRPDDFAVVRRRLALSDDTSEADLARALVASISAAHLSQVSLRSEQPIPRGDESRVMGGRGSILMQLGSDRGVDLERLDDVRTLLDVVRAGRLREQRAAVLRIGELLDKPKGIPAAHVRQAIDTLVHLRKFSLAYELSAVCARLPGADGRRARHGRRLWDALCQEVGQRVREYWEGTLSEEPLTALHADQRMQLLVRARDLPDETAYHIAAVIDGSVGEVDPDGRIALAGALRNAADARLLPAMRAALISNDGELAVQAARAIGRIPDARAHGVLKASFDRTTTAELRLAIAGALGLCGDLRGLSYVREVLQSSDDHLLPYALEALGLVGSTDDVKTVGELLQRDLSSGLRLSAIDTLGRIGDGRALVLLASLDSSNSAVRAAVEEARAAIIARVDLLGEEVPSERAVAQAFDTTKMAAIVRKRDPAAVQLRAGYCFAVGLLWMVLGASTRAVARFEAAAALRPDWVRPLLAIAHIHTRHHDAAQALAAFRRVLEIDRAAVEDHPLAVRMLAKSFLHRAEAMQKAGRVDIAHGLLEEALDLDLRKAPSGLRFALAERLDALRARDELQRSERLLATGAGEHEAAAENTR